MLRAGFVACLLGWLCLGSAVAQDVELPPFGVPANTGLAEAALRANPGPALWVEVDYLLWWMKPVCLPPATITTGNPADAVPGAIGQPGTVTALGATRFEFTGASGVKVSVGTWFGNEQSYGIFATGVMLPRVSNTRGFVSDPNGRPAYHPYVTPTAGHAAIPFAIPGQIVGAGQETGSSELWGVELSGAARGHFAAACDTTITTGLLLGGRYQFLQDRVEMRNQQFLLIPPFLAAAGENRFTTRNSFFGPQIGLMAGVSRGRWDIQYTQKIAAGMTRMEVMVEGGPLTAGSPVAPGMLPGPLLAMPSNVGTLVTDRVTLLPELNLKAYYRLRENVQLSLGYNLLYWNRIFCPGDLMDPHVNLTQLPGFGPLTGTAFPTRYFARTDYFAQGLEAGFNFEF